MGRREHVTSNTAPLLSRLSFSDSESDNSADSCLPGREPLPPQKPPPPSSKVSGVRLSAASVAILGGLRNACCMQLTGPGSPQVSGRRSPEPCSKPEKMLKKATYDKVGLCGPEGVDRWCLELGSTWCPRPTAVLLPRLTRMSWWSCTGD